MTVGREDSIATAGRDVAGMWVLDRCGVVGRRVCRLSTSRGRELRGSALK